MKALRLEVFEQNAKQYQLRFFAENQLQHSRQIAAQDLADFVSRCQRDYQNGLALKQLGENLFNWLNGAENTLAGYQQIHIPNSHQLGDLAWELLHNGENYCCAHSYQPFTPLRSVSKTNLAATPANRPLRLLFMASSPEDVTPVLDFEGEESRILNAINPDNADLVVEESGTLEGLKRWLIAAPADNFFDVVHLTGHAGMDDKGNPIFMLESDTASHQPATAEDIANCFNERGLYPRLLFLSGCQTAQSANTSLPSLCEALVKAGLPAVLGWAKPVTDTTATKAAQKLYELLAEGVDLARAVAKTRQTLWADAQKQTRTLQPEWHLLRLYTDHTPLTALVTAYDTPQRKVILPPLIEDEFLKTEKVCPASRFVGRRRLLQTALRCLQASKNNKTDYAQGVLLHGMGGLGKSSLAARLCDRLKSHYQRVIVVGKLDETALKQAFGQVLLPEIADINAQLNQDSQPLENRLGLLFRQFPQLNWLIVLDDFEQNLDYTANNRMDSTAYAVLTALLNAINRSNSKSRVIVTSRYRFDLTAPLRLHDLPLAQLQHADLQKKLRHLQADHLPDLAADKTELLKTAEELGAGNPRLLERLYQVLASEMDATALFSQLANTQAEFREELLLESLLNYQSPATRQVIASLALCEIFVPKAVLEAMLTPAMPASEVGASLAAAIAAGLVETAQDRYLVSRLLLPLLADELSAEEQVGLCTRAAECLDVLWWESDHAINLEEHSELSRLAELGGQKALYAKVTGPLANRFHKFCRYGEAKGLFDKLLPIYQELNDKEGEATTLNNLSQIYQAQGDYDTALVYLTESLAIGQDTGNKAAEGAILNNLATLANAQGDFDTALRYLTESLAIRQAIGDKKGEGQNLNNLGQIYLAQGDHGNASHYLTQALAILQAIGDKAGEGAALNNLGQICQAQGDQDNALHYLTQALTILQAIGDKAGEGATLSNISQIYGAQGDYDTALVYLTKSLAIQQAIGDKAGEGATLNNLATLAHAQGDFNKALGFLTESLAIRQAIGDKAGKGRTLNNLSQIYDAQGDYDTALRYLTESLAIQQAIGDRAGECTTLFNIGHIHLQNDEAEQAVSKWLQAYSIAKQIGLAQALQSLDRLAKNLGGEGLDWWETLSQAQEQN